jgi:hypothetical protein
MTVPNTTYRVLVEKLGDSDPSKFVGNEGEVFYDPNNPILKLSNGTTPGGVSVGSTGEGGGNANTGNIVFDGNDITNEDDINITSGDDLRITAYDVLALRTETDDVDIVVNYGGENEKRWTFNRDGNLELPFGSDILDDNGNSVLGGGITEETDPVFLASVASGITSTNISDWDTAYGWGDHSTVGYISSITAGSGISIDEIDGDITISAVGSNTISGIDTTGTSYFNDVQVSGVSVLGNTIVGGGTTELLVNGDVRIVGILTIGTSSITFDGSTNTVSVGSGITFDGTEGTINVGAGITLDATTGTLNVSSISIGGQEAANIGLNNVLQLQGPLTNQVIFSFDGSQSNSANVFVNVGNSTSPGVYLANYNIAYTGDIAVLSEPYGVANAWIGVGSTPSFNINNNSGIVELRMNLDSPSSVNVIVESKLYSSGITTVTPEPEPEPESPYTLTITSQPSDITLVEDNQDYPDVGILSVTVNLTGPEPEPDLPQVRYQWEISTDGGLNWTTMVTDGTYFGVYHENTQYTVSNSEPLLDALNIFTYNTSGDGYQYRCVVTLDFEESPYPYPGPTVISNVVTMTVVPATLSITSNPSNQTVNEGDFAVFEVAATTNQDNKGLIYQWYGSSDNGATWTELNDLGSYFGTTTETLNVVATMDINGYQYRCFVTTGAQFVQPSATSTAATLTVIPEEE